MDQVFLEIFNTAITAGWLVLAVILARLLLKNAPAWIKCALWAIVAVRLVWPFSFESMLSLLPSAEIIPPSQLYVPAPQVYTGISSLNAAINPVFTETFRSEPMNSVNPLQVALWVAGWIWVLGMVAMAVYAAVSYLRIHRRVRFSVPEGEGVYLCDQIPAPFILGIARPKIYLPSNLPREKWDSILAHERAHLARRDHWWKPLGFTLLTVFWFHPLLWVAYILLCRDVELACDERVIKDLSAEEKQAYSNTLLECSLPKKWITACPLAFGETGVKQRVKAVLRYRDATLWIILAAVLVCAVLITCFLTDPLKPASAGAEDFAGKQYVYTGEGAGGSFFINLYQDGTFEYYEGFYSSYIGVGDWEWKNDKLYLVDSGLSNPMIFVFSVGENVLEYIAEESHPFLYVDVKSGDRFVYHGDLPGQSAQEDLPGPAEQWHMIYQVIGLETGEFRLADFPNHTFRWGDGKIQILCGASATTPVENVTICNFGAVDLNLDGYPELVATLASENKGEYVWIYDLQQDKTYTMEDASGVYAYYLYTERINEGYIVMCAKHDVQSEKTTETGRLIFHNAAPAIKSPSLHLLSGEKVQVLYNMRHPDSDNEGQVDVEGFPGLSVRWYYRPNIVGGDRPVMVKNGKETILFEGYPAPMSLYLADVTDDGNPDLCADVYYFFSGVPSYGAVCVYDIANDRYYILADAMNWSQTKLSYYLRMDNGKLVCDKVAEMENSVLATGTLYLDGSDLRMRAVLTYDFPISYTYAGENNREKVVLTVIHEGSCKMYFTHKPSGGVTGSWLFGTYTKTDGMLYFHTEEDAVYVFRFEGDDLVFEAKKSSPLPENCTLSDGIVLKAKAYYE